MNHHRLTAWLKGDNSSAAAQGTVPFAALARPGLYLGHGPGGLVLARPDQHALILGPPRSGKTTRLIIPALVSHPGPAVVTSTKPDIAVLTARHRSQTGRCWWWDPSGETPPPARLDELRWSPVTGCDRWAAAVARAGSLARAARPAHGGNDTHWVERAQALLAPLLHAAALLDGDLAVVLSWLHRRELLQPHSILTERGSGLAADILTGIAETDPREASGIFSTADGILAAYRSDTALATTVNPNLDVEAFVASGDTLYLCPPASVHALHAPLVVALLEQIATATYQTRPWPPVAFVLDEIAQVAPLPGLPATLAEGGSQGLIVMAALQDLSQARVRWGEAADGFFTLFTHKLVLPGIGDLTTLRAISALAGDVEVPVRSTSKVLFGSATTSWSTRLQPALPVDMIARGEPGRALLITGTQLSTVDLPLPPLR